MAASTLPPLNWLRAFEASARHLSFTRAARELHMTQSAVSQQIKALERYLGRALFVRRPRAVTMTEAGHNYLPCVQDAFATLSAGTRALAGADRGRALSVRSNMAFAVFWLAPRLPALFDRHPWLSLDITPGIWDSVPSEPGEASVEVRFGRAPEGDRIERLSADACYPVCTPALAAGGADWRSQALFDCSGVLGNWQAWLADQGERLPDGRRVNLSATYAVSLTAVVHGAGLGMAHDTIASDLLGRQLLVRPFEHALAMAEAYFLSPPPENAATPASDAFCEWLRETIGA